MMVRPVKKLYVEYFNDYVKKGMLDYKEPFHDAMEGGYYFESKSDLTGFVDSIESDRRAKMEENYIELIRQAFKLWEESGSQVIMFDPDAEAVIGNTENIDGISEQEICDAFPYEVCYLKFNFDDVYDGAFLVMHDGKIFDTELPRILTLCKRCGIKGGVRDPKEFDNVHYNSEYVRNLCLYVSSLNADCKISYEPTNDRRALANRKKKRSSARVTKVGYRIGSAIRRHREHQARNKDNNDGIAVTPHIRRAHWHRFWTGPMNGDRKLVTKWLHPILVGASDEREVATTLHMVKRQEN